MTFDRWEVIVWRNCRAVIRPQCVIICTERTVRRLTFDRGDDVEVGETGGSTVAGSGWAFKCKCTFYLYLYANELFPRRGRGGRGGGEKGTTPGANATRSRVPVCARLRKKKKKQADTRCRKTIIASRALTSQLSEIANCGFGNFDDNNRRCRAVPRRVLGVNHAGHRDARFRASLRSHCN